jgi:hypothetical protein
MSIGFQIEIHNLKKVDLKGGILIDGFPSVGLFRAQRPVPNDPVSVMDSPLLSINIHGPRCDR